MTKWLITAHLTSCLYCQYASKNNKCFKNRNDNTNNTSKIHVLCVRHGTKTYMCIISFNCVLKRKLLFLTHQENRHFSQQYSQMHADSYASTNREPGSRFRNRLNANIDVKFTSADCALLSFRRGFPSTTS